MGQTGPVSRTRDEEQRGVDVAKIAVRKSIGKQFECSAMFEDVLICRSRCRFYMYCMHVVVTDCGQRRQ